MIVGTNGDPHLTYCLNVHAGETWDENLEAIKTHALAVRERVAPGRRFGLGLRLGNEAACSLAEPHRLAALRAFLDAEDLYAFTINGFPFGQFHGTSVKENVYAPDWRTAERVAYTKRLADILAALLPEGVPGSISTVPATYRAWVQGDSDIDGIVANLADVAAHLSRLEQETGRHIALALEPEPDCLFDNVSQTVAFFNGVLAEHRMMAPLGFDWRRYLGVCLDTCHLAVAYDDPTDGLIEMQRQGIAVPKVQLSAALRACANAETAAWLGRFADATYLHQVRLRDANGAPDRYADLSAEALRDIASRTDGEVRVHVHVPLYYEGAGSLRSTASELTEDFFHALRTAGVQQLEIETYTFDVLPESISSLPVEESIAREYRWVLDRLAV